MTGELWRDGHPREETLEEYSFGRLSEDQAAAVEEHYLWCEACRTALETVESEIHTVRAAFAAEALTPRAPASQFVVWSRRWKEAWTLHRPAFATAAVALVAVTGAATYAFRPQAPWGEPLRVQLTSLRGAEGGSVPAGRPLDIELDARGVPQGSASVQIVTADGKPVWSGSGRVNGDKLSFRLSNGLAAGQYWVRLSGQDGSLASEFGLRIGE